MEKIEKVERHYDRLTGVNNISLMLAAVFILTACVCMFGFGYYVTGFMLLIASLFVSQGASIYIKNNLEYKE